MRYYLNELSLVNLPNESGLLEQLIRHFIKHTILLKKIGYRELRSYIYLLDIKFPNGQLLASWVQNRNNGNREIKTRFKSISLKAPLFSDLDANHSLLEWSSFKFKDAKGLGIGAAYISNSLVISFNCDPSWSYSKIHPVTYERIDCNTILESEISINNVSRFNHVVAQKENVYESLITQISVEGWTPIENPLPNLEFTNRFLKIDRFYKNFQKLGRQEKVASALSIGEKVALLNNYNRQDEISKFNSSREKIRVIYISNNIEGKKVYLSVDIEKAAFEVCNDKGEHQYEMLYNGTVNGRQKLNHGIKLTK